MPISLQDNHFVLPKKDVSRLWGETIRLRKFADEAVNIKCVSTSEIRTLNKHYRKQNKPTNVLTFSYAAVAPHTEGEHDVALCVEIAEAEAAARGVPLREYVALLLVHAFLHVTGMDHEQSEAEAQQTHEAEATILVAAGFPAAALSA